MAVLGDRAGGVSGLITMIRYRENDDGSNNDLDKDDCEDYDGDDDNVWQLQ